MTGDVELVTFAVDQRVAGVEVLRPSPVFVGQVGVSASDEPENLPPAGVGEGEDDAVPETVDESSGADAGSQASGEEFVSGRALSSQVGGEAVPTVRGVTRPQLRVAGQVEAEPVSQVALTPGAGVAGLVVVEGLGVELDKPFRGDVGVVEVLQTIDGKRKQSQYEIDFVVNTGKEKVYIQSALNVDDPEKRKQETFSLKHSGDFYRKIVVLDGNQRMWTDEDGIIYVGIIPFLLDVETLKILI